MKRKAVGAAPTAGEQRPGVRRERNRELLAERWAEVAAYLAGELPDEKYPPWVRNVGRKVASVLIPPEWRRSIEADRNGFVAGVAIGFLVSGFQPPTNKKEAEAMVDSRAAAASAADEIMKYVSAAGHTRWAFFSGLGIGLDFEHQSKALHLRLEGIFRNRKRSPDLARALFLWLNWPLMESLKKPAAIYDVTRKAFEEMDAAEGIKTIFPKKEAFRRALERLASREPREE